MIADDITRCTGGQHPHICPRREQCTRYRQALRDVYRWRHPQDFPWMSAPSLHLETCEFFIEEKE